jgi:multiple antibiotic resistance protein
MIETIRFVLLAITSIVAVIEPASNVAIFIGLTENLDGKEKRRIVSKAMKISFLVLAFFAVAGNLVFLVFNITISAFLIAGGILLVDVALRMLHPKKDEYSAQELEDIATVPLSFPLTAGPGSITTVMLLVSQASGLLEFSFVFVGIFAGILISYLGMTYSDRLAKLLGKEGLHVVTRILAIIVLAIAVQFLINGITQVISNVHP